MSESAGPTGAIVCFVILQDTAYNSAQTDGLMDNVDQANKKRFGCTGTYFLGPIILEQARKTQ